MGLARTMKNQHRRFVVSPRLVTTPLARALHERASFGRAFFEKALLVAASVLLLQLPASAGEVHLVTDSGNDRVWRCVDLTGDGDLDDAGEVVVFYDDVSGTIPLSNNSGLVCDPGGATYVTDTTEDIILFLADGNANGNALDAGEAFIWFDGRAGGNLSGVLMTSANSLAIHALEGAFYVASANTGTAGTLDEILRLRDEDDDGDANDASEAKAYWTAPLGAVGDYLPTAVCVGADQRVHYVENGSTGVTQKGVYRLVDLNNDGDAQDASERQPYFLPPATVPAAQYFSLDRDAGGWFYLADQSNELIWRFKDQDGDGDAQDTGESVAWYVAGVPSVLWDVSVGADGTVYASDAQAPQRILALRDADGSGVIDAGEVDVIYDETAGGAVIGIGRGLDIERAPPPGTGFCFGDGTGLACPCGNFGATRHGCAHSLSTNGALLDAVGVASVASDTLRLVGSSMPNSSALYFQGSAQVGAGGVGAAFGDGLRCAGGTVVRLKTVQNASGKSQYPEAGDPSVSVRGMVAAGDLRAYQVWYRNAASFCTTATFNLTNGLSIAWTP
jgi:hypothetical protein